MSSESFRPEATLVEGMVQRNCRAVVILPARNEEAACQRPWMR
jgi:hypothetical protein